MYVTTQNSATIVIHVLSAMSAIKGDFVKPCGESSLQRVLFTAYASNCNCNNGHVVPIHSNNANPPIHFFTAQILKCVKLVMCTLCRTAGS